MPEAVPGNPVIVTRPLAQASALARRIEALGRRAILFPLLDIGPLPDQAALKAALARLDQFALVAFVSPNAIAAAFAARPDWPLAVPLAVMGEGSRAALAERGVNDGNARILRPRDGRRTDSETLLAALDLPALKGREVLILRGESGREFLADGLRAAGVNVTQVAAYRRSAPALDAERTATLRALLDSANDWIITSSEALQYLLHMVARVAGDEGLAKIQDQSMIVPHVRIAESAKKLGFRTLTLTGSGDDQLIAALQSRV